MTNSEGFPRRALLQLAAGFVVGASAWHLWPWDPTSVLAPIPGPKDPLALHPELAAPKQPDEIRIVCVGDSLTFGYPYGLHASFAAIAEAGLRAVWPERRILVKAIAQPAIDSTQIVTMVEASLASKPDAIVVTLGGNEVGSRLFHGRALTSDGLLDEISDHATRSRLAFQALAPSAIATVATTSEGRPDLVAGLVARALDARPGKPVVGALPVSASDRAALAERARGSLRAMAAAARAAGVPLLFAPSPYDLVGAWPRGMTAVDRDVDGAVLAWQRGEPITRTVAEALVRVHPDRADVHALLGRVLLAAAEPRAARAAFERARDLDAAPLHPIGEVIATIRSEGEALGVPVLDADAGTYLPGTDLPDPTCFLDPQHWTVEGAQRAAAWFVERLAAERLLPPLPGDWRATFDAAAAAHVAHVVPAAARQSATAEMARATAVYHLLFGNARDAALPMAAGIEWLAGALPGPEATVWVDWATRLAIATAGAAGRIDALFAGTPDAQNQRGIALTKAMWTAARERKLREYVLALIGGAAFP